LISLNDVGGDVRQFGHDVADFHYGNTTRLENFPHTMLTTSTHDSKRNEDVRARINVLSELTDQWQTHLTKWRKINRSKRSKVEKRTAPSRNDEYLFFQTLLGVWPFTPMEREQHKHFIERIFEYMIKAAREAKRRTSWINPDKGYEVALQRYVQKVLKPSARNAFLKDFVPFAEQIAWYGMLNSLGQILLKIASVGVPDIYQGNEVWRFCLVDPDNRRAVDFEQRVKMLTALKELVSDGPEADLASRVRTLLTDISDARIKLYVTWRALGLRRVWPEVFQHGEYLALETAGTKKQHLIALARHYGAKTVLVVVPRWCVGLVGEKKLPVGEQVWDDTMVLLPDTITARSFRNVYTAETVIAQPTYKTQTLSASALLSQFPVGLFISETNQTEHPDAR
jgi:(1->4)-alpha-D-glucan 1-alpha-D-glucosylmutase